MHWMDKLFGRSRVAATVAMTPSVLINAPDELHGWFEAMYHAEPPTDKYCSAARRYVKLDVDRKAPDMASSEKIYRSLDGTNGIGSPHEQPNRRVMERRSVPSKLN